jgi:hypothetical protein
MFVFNSIGEGGLACDIYAKTTPVLKNVLFTLRQAQLIKGKLKSIAALSDDEWFDIWEDSPDIPGESIYPEFMEVVRLVEKQYNIGEIK